MWYRPLGREVDRFERILERLKNEDITAWDWQKLTQQLLLSARDITSNALREDAGETQREVLPKAERLLYTAAVLLEKNGNPSRDIEELKRRSKDLLVLAGEGAQKDREWREHVRCAEMPLWSKMISYFGKRDSDRGHGNAR